MAADLNPFKQQLQDVLASYQQYVRLDPDPPPTHGFSDSPRDGRLKIVQGHFVWEGHACLFQRNILLGVTIGAKFAEPTWYHYPAQEQWQEARAARQKIVNSLKEKVEAILLSLKEAKGGSILNSYGTAYTTLGWCLE